MKVILDASVLIAAFATRGLCQAVFETCLRSHEIWLSEKLIEEVDLGLARKIRLPPHIVREVLAMIRKRAQLAIPSQVDPKSCRDAGDLHVLGACVAAEADILVTGDKDLLDLKKFRNTRILSPREFWNMLARS